MHANLLTHHNIVFTLRSLHAGCKIASWLCVFILSTLTEKSPSLLRPFSPTPTYGYICRPSEQEDVDDEQESQAAGLQRTAPRSTPSSCCSDLEGSLWNGWGSMSEGNTTSARTSIISSSDGSFMSDVNYARIMAMTAESMSGTLSGKRGSVIICNCQTYIWISN